MFSERGDTDQADGVCDDKEGENGVCTVQGDITGNGEGGDSGEVHEGDVTGGASAVIFPDNFHTEINGSLARINWIRRIGESRYAECGVRFVEGELSGGCMIWIIEFGELDFKALFSWSGMTDGEMVRVIEVLKGEREVDDV